MVLAQNAQSEMREGIIVKESRAHELVQWCRCPVVAGSRAAQSVLHAHARCAVRGRGRTRPAGSMSATAMFRRDVCRPRNPVRAPPACRSAVARFHTRTKVTCSVPNVHQSSLLRLHCDPLTWMEQVPNRFPPRDTHRMARHRSGFRGRDENRIEPDKPPPGDRTRH